MALPCARASVRTPACGEPVRRQGGRRTQAVRERSPIRDGSRRQAQDWRTCPLSEGVSMLRLLRVALLMLALSPVAAMANTGVAFVHGTGHQTNALADYWTSAFV